MGTRGERTVKQSSSESSPGNFLSRDDYLQRLKDGGMQVRVKRSALANDWIHVKQGQLSAQIRFFEVLPSMA